DIASRDFRVQVVRRLCVRRLRRLCGQRLWPCLDERLRERAEERRLAQEAAVARESARAAEEARAERAARLAEQERAEALRAAEEARRARADRPDRPAEGEQDTGGRSPAPDGDFVLPVSGATMTAGFGQGGDLWSSGSHTGVDLAAPAGTPIRAVADGTVTTVSTRGPLGNHTVLTLADGTEVGFSHQQSVAVKRGDRVRAGQEIGAVGATGNTTGPHLHLEVRTPGGALIDPVAWLADRGVAL
ncbi:M23 family metallopeptidase, partial [Streptomyces sp. NPDC047097]|uniref:M23 family metallopeptidase n=1 Tax=Streptomyces sp. NPDC047097 TaxID=3155260 RepID=UPI0033F782F0